MDVFELERIALHTLSSWGLHVNFPQFSDLWIVRARPLCITVAIPVRLLVPSVQSLPSPFGLLEHIGHLVSLAAWKLQQNQDEMEQLMQDDRSSFNYTAPHQSENVLVTGWGVVMPNGVHRLLFVVETFAFDGRRHVPTVVSRGSSSLICIRGTDVTAVSKPAPPSAAAKCSSSLSSIESSHDDQFVSHRFALVNLVARNPEKCEEFKREMGKLCVTPTHVAFEALPISAPMHFIYFFEVATLEEVDKLKSVIAELDWANKFNPIKFSHSGPFFFGDITMKEMMKMFILGRRCAAKQVGDWATAIYDPKLLDESLADQQWMSEMQRVISKKGKTLLKDIKKDIENY